MANKTGLGKGLDALFGDMKIPEEETKKEGEVIEKIKISKIEPNKDQARKKFDKDKLDELANSIKEYGILQPIIVTTKKDYYEIVAGERRWRAAKIAGLKEMPCIVRNEETKKNMEISLIENIQRENLNPMEKARGLRAILDNYGMTQQELADKLGISRSALTNNVRILNLDKRVIELVEKNHLTERHCRALLRIADLDEQYKMALKIVENNESIVDTERQIENTKKLPKKEDKKKKYEAIYRDIEDTFQGFFGNKVSLEAGKRKGKIIIEYTSNDDLERMLSLLK